MSTTTDSASKFRVPNEESPLLVNVLSTTTPASESGAPDKDSSRGRDEKTSPINVHRDPDGQIALPLILPSDRLIAHLSSKSFSVPENLSGQKIADLVRTCTTHFENYTKDDKTFHKNALQARSNCFEDWKKKVKVSGKTPTPLEESTSLEDRLRNGVTAEPIHKELCRLIACFNEVVDAKVRKSDPKIPDNMTKGQKNASLIYGPILDAIKRLEKSADQLMKAE